MTAEQLALDCDPDWTRLYRDPDDAEIPDRRHRDLIRCGLTPQQLHTMTDVPTGSYL